MAMGDGGQLTTRGVLTLACFVTALLNGGIDYLDDHFTNSILFLLVFGLRDLRRLTPLRFKGDCFF